MSDPRGISVAVAPALIGFLALTAGVWSVFGWGWALIVGGALILADAVREDAHP